MCIVYCVCLLFAPMYHRKFLVGENLLGSKNLSDSASARARPTSTGGRVDHKNHDLFNGAMASKLKERALFFSPLASRR